MSHPDDHDRVAAALNAMGQPPGSSLSHSASPATPSASSRQPAARLPPYLASSVRLTPRRSPSTQVPGETLIPSFIVVGLLMVLTALAPMLLGKGWVVSALPTWVRLLVLVTGMLLITMASMHIVIFGRRSADES